MPKLLVKLPMTKTHKAKIKFEPLAVVDDEITIIEPACAPSRVGYMPLSAAAHWVASKSNQIRSDDPAWEPAFKDILALVASGDA
jgi:hypothetical protein